MVLSSLFLWKMCQFLSISSWSHSFLWLTPEIEVDIFVRVTSSWKRNQHKHLSTITVASLIEIRHWGCWTLTLAILLSSSSSTFFGVVISLIILCHLDVHTRVFYLNETFVLDCGKSHNPWCDETVLIQMDVFCTKETKKLIGINWRDFIKRFYRTKNLVF